MPFTPGPSGSEQKEPKKVPAYGLLGWAVIVKFAAAVMDPSFTEILATA